MKICLFSDIHGNGPAFQAAYPLIIAEQADWNIFLGDLCGYYFDVPEVFDLLSRMPRLAAIKGNHDQMFLSIAAGDEELRKSYLLKYGSSIEYLLKSDYSKIADWLSARPESFSLKDERVLACHASPWSPLEGYIYPDSDLEKFAALQPSVFFLGHTHYPMEKEFAGKWIVNPGSLGQPRLGGWPTYSTVILPERKVEFKEVRYDKQLLLKKIDEAGDPKPYLKEVLLRGNS